MLGPRFRDHEGGLGRALFGLPRGLRPMSLAEFLLGFSLTYVVCVFLTESESESERERERESGRE